MLLKHLYRIEEFRHLQNYEFEALAKRIRVLYVPAKRWLIRPGLAPDVHLYLLRGGLKTRGPDRRWRSRPLGRLRHFYPGCEAARTYFACQILVIDSAQHDFLIQRPDNEIALGDEEWLGHFLNSQMMARVSVDNWRRILAGFERRCYHAGEAITRYGEVGECCYIIERGHAVIHRQGQTLRHLNPGDFFGEDALILNGRRTADVTALEQLVVHRLSREVFENTLLTHLVQPATVCAEGTRLDLDVHSLVDIRDQVTALSRRTTYYVVGAEYNERVLAAFILCQHGLDARPVQASTQ